MKIRNTFAIEAEAKIYEEVETIDALKLCIDKNKTQEILVLGKGANILLCVDVFDGLVIDLQNKNIDIEEETEEYIRLKVGAGADWNDLIKFCVEKNLYEIANLVGIPASVGGAVVQNIGAYGAEIKDIVEAVEVLDYSTKTFSTMETKLLKNADCNFAYRNSIFKSKTKDYIVWQVYFKLNKNSCPNLSYDALKEYFSSLQTTPLASEIAEKIREIRASKLPDIEKLGCAGSFFANPYVSKELLESIIEKYPNLKNSRIYYKDSESKDGEKYKISAAWLIEQCGWKGYSDGKMAVYEKQPLVLINQGQAKGEDILELSRRIKRSVKEKIGIELKEEVCIIESKYQRCLNEMFTALPMFQRIGAAAYKADIQTTIDILEYLGNPHKKLKCIHIAGTNGKGSTSSLIASTFTAAGYKTALYTSPHLVDFRERIRIDGKMIDKNFVISFYEKHKAFFKEKAASFFEMSVAMAFDYFAAENVDIAVIEVGMGGRLDSTNVISPEISIITNISKDHTNFLGDTIEKIAREKSGIIKENTPVVIGESIEGASEVFREVARQKNVKTLIFADKEYSARAAGAGVNRVVGGVENKYILDIYKASEPYILGLESELKGASYQSKNILTVLAALDLLKSRFKIDEKAIREGFANVNKNTGLRGRWELLDQNPKVYTDTGHNEAGTKLVLEQIASTEHSDLHIVWGMVNDKDIDAALSLLPKDAKYYFCAADIPRAMPEEDIKTRAEKFGLKGQAYRTVLEAFRAAKASAQKDDLIYIGGSTFVAAEIIKYFNNNAK